MRYFRASLLTIAALAMVTAPIGCSAAPSTEYVQQDRATYSVIAPATTKILDGNLPSDEERVTIVFSLDRWDERVATAPDSDYVRGDRATNKAIAPFVRSVLDGSLPLADVDADERQGKRNTLATWDLRIRGEEGTSS